MSQDKMKSGEYLEDIRITTRLSQLEKTVISIFRVLWYLDTMSIRFNSFLLQVTNKSVAKLGAYQVGQEKQVYKRSWRK